MKIKSNFAKGVNKKEKVNNIFGFLLLKICKDILILAINKIYSSALLFGLIFNKTHSKKDYFLILFVSKFYCRLSMIEAITVYKVNWLQGSTTVAERTKAPLFSRIVVTGHLSGSNPLLA